MSSDPVERAVDAGPRISGCVVAMNEEDRIADCILSLAFCDEVIVIDSHSTDRTREVARELGAAVIERDWPGHGAQKEFAAQTARNDWVLSLDADERVSSRLREEIRELQRRGFPGHKGWRMPRLAAYLGRWVRFGSWYPNRQLRLYDRRCGHWAGADPHERVTVAGSIGRLRGRILHYPFRSLAEHLRTIDNYTTIMARGLARRGRRATVFDITLRPTERFLRSYFWRLGFLMGWRGLVLAYLEAHYVRLKYMKLLVEQHGDLPPPPLD